MDGQRRERSRIEDEVMAVKKRGKKGAGGQPKGNVKGYSEPDADFKRSGDVSPVKVPDGNRSAVMERFVDATIAAALKAVCERIPQHIRNHYVGSTEINDRSNSSVEITIALRDKRCSDVVSATRLVRPLDVAYQSAKTEGKTLGEALASEIIMHEQMCEVNPPKPVPYKKSMTPEDKYKDRIITGCAADLTKAKPKVPKDRKPKVICKICGPEDSMYPDWDGVCVHD